MIAHPVRNLMTARHFCKPKCYWLRWLNINERLELNKDIRVLKIQNNLSCQNGTVFSSRSAAHVWSTQIGCDIDKVQKTTNTRWCNCVLSLYLQASQLGINSVKAQGNLELAQCLDSLVEGYLLGCILCKYDGISLQSKQTDHVTWYLARSRNFLKRVTDFPIFVYVCRKKHTFSSFNGKPIELFWVKRVKIPSRCIANYVVDYSPWISQSPWMATFPIQ